MLILLCPLFPHSSLSLSPCHQTHTENSARILSHLKAARDVSTQAECAEEARESTYLLSLTYNTLGMEQERDDAAREFLKWDKQLLVYSVHGSPL